MIDTLCIVGIGLIGGSLGLAVKERGLAKHVVGVARRPETLEKAVACGACDEATSDILEVAARADFFFLSPPVGQMKPLCEQIASVVRTGAIITDAGSTKAAIVRECAPLFNGKAAFVGGHPMAGSEQTGVEAARANLFEGAKWLFTPSPRTPDFAISNVRKLASAVGATPLVLDPEVHDQLLAVTSHLPHVTASALVHSYMRAREEHEITAQLVAGGWRDSTRIAAGSPEMWRDILLANREAITESLDDLIGELQAVRSMLGDEAGDDILKWFDEAAIARRKQGYIPRAVK
jgi:prephenate dehydrogenase